MLSTLALVKRMTAAGMTPQQAEAVAESLVTTLEDNVASKRDVGETRRDILVIEANLKRDLREIESNLKRDLKEMEAALRRDLSDGKRDIKELDLKMEKLNAESQRHTVHVGIGMALFIIAMIGFLFRFLART